MSLDKLEQIDAVGIDRRSGYVVLTIADYWDWADEEQHLLALQSKLNSYFRFIESGQIYSSYPQAHGRSVAIDVVGKHPLPPAAEGLLLQASRVAEQIQVTITNRRVP